METSITSIKGIGEKKAELFNKIGIKTVDDLVNYFPRTYEDRSKLARIYDVKDSETVCIRATVFSDVSNSFKHSSCTLADESGKIKAIWFNNRFVKNQLKKYETYIFFGKIERRGEKRIINPIFEKEEKSAVTGKIMPIYPLTYGLNQKMIQSAVSSVFEGGYVQAETLPERLRNTYGVCSLEYALRQIHFPKDEESLATARKRLVFDELLSLQLALMQLKKANSAKNNFKINTDYYNEFCSLLPFELTDSQKKVISEINTDLKGEKSALRLIQGDVGCGKTVVSAAAMYSVCKSGYQTAIMVPTEILAVQHFETLSSLFEGKLNVCLLTGSMTAKQKSEAREMIASGKADIICGTHALIQKDVQYKSLALIVTDEQHRFGVMQRNEFLKKGENPHMLVMSATPIPRTLAMILYGDLDISVITSLPRGRKSVKTYAVGEDKRERVYNFIRREAEKGHQTYIVCPLALESEDEDLKNAEEYAVHLQNNVFKNLNVSLVHGKMNPSQKDLAMLDFKNGKTDILVSTTVIEVGVDVPNATLMIVENAERFGLSQLHQLRGRVGRGKDESFCILFCSCKTDVSRERMKAMTNTNDGFKIAELDLKLRGPGEFFGVRQHGLPAMKIADIGSDIEILSLAQSAAKQILTQKSDDTKLLLDKSRDFLLRAIL